MEQNVKVIKELEELGLDVVSVKTAERTGHYRVRFNQPSGAVYSKLLSSDDWRINKVLPTGSQSIFLLQRKPAA